MNKEKLKKAFYNLSLWDCPETALFDTEYYLNELIRNLEETNDEVLINLSGHSEIKFQVPNVADINSVISVAEELLQHIVDNPQWLDACKKGTSTLVLPMLPVLHSVFISMYHAIFGYLPKIKWYVKTEEGFKLVSQAFDLQVFRDSYRANRNKYL